MDIEEIAAKTPGKMRKASVDVRHLLACETADQLVNGLDLNGANDAVAETLVKLYKAYATNDAELLEINPLVLTGANEVMALDCKFVMDDSAIKRQNDLAPGTPDKLTGLGEDWRRPRYQVHRVRGQRGRLGQWGRAGP